jgi:hypothetical protein
MRLGLRTHWLSLPAVAVLAALAFAPGTAKAECGDYLMSRHAAKITDESPAKPPVPCPCKGPQCSQRPDLPLLPPAPPPSVAPAEWATIFTKLVASANDGRDFLLDSNASDPIHRTDPIFHPPRLNG